MQQSYYAQYGYNSNVQPISAGAQPPPPGTLNPAPPMAPPPPDDNKPPLPREPPPPDVSILCVYNRSYCVYTD